MDSSSGMDVPRQITCTSDWFDHAAEANVILREAWRPKDLGRGKVVREILRSAALRSE